jgi:hypothetical protein
MQDTEYYKSGKQRENCLAARIFADQKRTENKQKRIDEYNLSPSICGHCAAAMSYTKRKNKFCNSRCAATYNHRLRVVTGYVVSEATKQKISKTVTNTLNDSAYTRPEIKTGAHCKLHEIVCSVCSTKRLVSWSKKYRKTCGSADCVVQASVGERNYINGRRKPSWFYNPNEGKEVLLDSSWEVEIAQFLIDNSVKWIRPKFVKWTDVHGTVRRYFPDFYLVDYDVYLDPKNPFGIVTGKDKIERVFKLITLAVGDKEYIKQYVLNLL